MKKFVYKLIGKKNYTKLKGYKLKFRLITRLISNYINDFILYYKHSSLFKMDCYNKQESEIVLKYHSIEKGLTHDPFKFRFGVKNLTTLISLLNMNDIAKKNNSSQIKAACIALCSYYERHLENNIDISDYFSFEDYTKFKGNTITKLSSTKIHSAKKYFENKESNFLLFSNSRCSVRNYTGETISLDIIQKVIDLAKNAPSVCNRQSVKIHYVENKSIISEILNIQKGLKGNEENINQLLVVTSDRNYFYSVGERNQLYIDGGIFLMNLLYSLHYYKIAACPAHWGLDYESDIKIQKLLNMRKSEKVISIVSIGIPMNEFKTTLSLRRSNDEILSIIK